MEALCAKAIRYRSQDGEGVKRGAGLRRTTNIAKLQRAAQRGRTAKLFTRAAREEASISSSESECDEPPTEISLAQFLELKALFKLVCEGKTAMSLDKFRKAFNEPGTGPFDLDEVQQFYEKHLKKSMLAQDRVWTRGQLPPADFEGFLHMIMPRGFTVCEYPDPAKHFASPEALWRHMYSDQGEDRSLKRGRSRLPKLPQERLRCVGSCRCLECKRQNDYSVTLPPQLWNCGDHGFRHLSLRTTEIGFPQPAPAPAEEQTSVVNGRGAVVHPRTSV